MPPATVPAPHELHLMDAPVLTTGQLRQIFQDPRDPRMLIKVLRADAIERRWGGRARWYKRLPRTLHYGGYVREFKEYIATRARKPELEAPIAHVVGIVHTDLGLGLVTEKVQAADGGLAPTLAALYERERGFSPAIERALARFLDDLLACNVIVGDMHAWNIVHGSDSRSGERFVLIDGFGEKHLVPLASMSRRFNARNTRKLYRRMREQLQRLVPLGSTTSSG
ncbi:MAG: YrbL family protein [Dokdonella sp.]